MEPLTTAQAKIVIEYLGTQAAEDMPIGTTAEQETHLWQTQYTASIAIGRKIGATDWELLVEACTDLQSFDRDQAGYLHESGFEDTEQHRTEMDAHLQYQVSWRIDQCFANSGA